MDSIDVKTLDSNLPLLKQDDLERVKCELKNVRNWAESPYPIDKDLNQRIVLYTGDIELLRAEAIVNPTNEHLTKMDYITNLAGPQLEHFVRNKLRNCPTGDVCLSPGFESNYKFIIHAVPPKYKAKYKTAAETALFHTYFRIIQTMIERKIRTCIVPMLTTIKGNLPIQDHCNIQLRTFRKILERKRHEFDRFVLHINQINNNNNIEQEEDEEEQEKIDEIYLKLFKCYFPQTKLDEELACYLIESDSLGGPNGEPLIPERQIRIKSKPSASSIDFENNHLDNQLAIDNRDQLQQNSIDLKTGLDLSTVVGMTPFSKMREDLNANTTSANNNSNRAILTATSKPQLATRSLAQIKQVQYCTIC